MIVDVIKGDILDSGCNEYANIGFAVNKEGFNDSGFAGVVSGFWPELANTGPLELGTVLSRRVGPRVFHAIVCHSLREEGWNGAPAAIEKALRALSDIHVLTSVIPGSGMIGTLQGADVLANIGAFARSDLNVVLFNL